MNKIAIASVWSTTSFATTPKHVPKIVVAADALMGSDIGMTFKGQLVLQAAVADGDNPATHRWVWLYDSAADREAFAQVMQTSPAGNQFLDELAALGASPISTTLYKTVKSWGEVNDTDGVWFLHTFNTSDRPGFVAAIDKFVASPTGQKAPFQVYLSSVVAGGQTPINQVTSVGYASETEMDAWFTVRNASSDWGTYLREVVGKAEFLGSSLYRNVNRWGPGKNV